MSDEKSGADARAYRQVPADLIETVPDAYGLSHWILASPVLLFFAWIWIDVFAHFSPIPSYWVDAVIALALCGVVAILPIGVAAFYVVSSLPKLFGHAGWDVQPLEPVSEAEMYMVRYRYKARRRAANSWGQWWRRAAQGWVYLEIMAILVGAVVMVPIFISVNDFGFGQ